MVDKAVQKPIYWRALYSVLLIGASVFLTLIFMEGILRLFPGLLPLEVQQLTRANPRNYGVSHPYIGHLHTPNNALVISGRDFRAVHHTDGYGFRNPWPWPKTAEIVTLGDSLTFGQGVEDNQAWPAILARSFPTKHVINLGLIGAGPQQYLRVYETFGLNLHPKLVLVGFFIGNDFWDAEMFDRWLNSGAGGNYMVWRDFGKVQRPSLSLYQPVGQLLQNLRSRAQELAGNSQLYSLVLYARGVLKTRVLSGRKIFQAPGGTQLELVPRNLARNTSEVHPGRPVFQRVLDALQRINSSANRNGAQVLVVLQPSKEETYLPLLGEPAPDPAAPLRTALGNMGIPYLDLLPEFRGRAAKGEVLFFETDGHPNARGYALIAELVTSHLKQHTKEYGL